MALISGRRPGHGRQAEARLFAAEGRAGRDRRRAGTRRASALAKEIGDAAAVRDARRDRARSRGRRRWRQAAEDFGGRSTVLVNNAGIVHVRRPCATADAGGLPPGDRGQPGRGVPRDEGGRPGHDRRRQPGSIVNISSVAGLTRPGRRISPTRASKWAVTGHDQVGGAGAGLGRDPGELDPPRHDRHAPCSTSTGEHRRSSPTRWLRSVPSATGRRGHARGRGPAGAVPGLRRQQLLRRGRSSSSTAASWPASGLRGSRSSQ